MTTLIEMLIELTDCRLAVELVPAPQPRHTVHYVRRVVGQNPPWYRQLCNRYASSRKRRKLAFDTRIRRANIESVLTRLAEGKSSSSQYAEDLLEIAKKRGKVVDRYAAKRHAFGVA